MAEPLTKNPAHLLADLLESLEVPANTPPETVHGFDSALDVEAWRRHADRLAMVRSVDEHLRVLAMRTDTSVFEPSLPYWYAGVGMALTPWGSLQSTSQPRRACPPEHLSLLRALGMLIDARPHLSVDETDRRSLLDVVEEASTLLASEDDMDPVIRDYLTRLLQRISFVLDNLERYGAEPLRALAFELAGAMYTQAIREREEPKKRRWAVLGWGFVGAFLSRSAQGGADDVNALIEHGLKAIGGP